MRKQIRLMYKKVFVFLCGIFLHDAQSFCMEQLQRNEALFKEVATLLENKGRRLKRLVQEENDGRYSHELTDACEILEKFFNSGNIEHIASAYDPKVIHRAQLVARRQNDRKKFIEAIDTCDFAQADKVIEDNPDVVNAYKNYGLLGGQYTPLHEYVEADDLLSIGYLLMHGRQKINKNALGGKGFSDKPVLCLARSSCAMKKLLNSGGVEISKSTSDRNSVLFKILNDSHNFPLDRAECVVKWDQEYGNQNIVHNIIDNSGITLLHKCIKWDISPHSCIKFLLHHKANPLQADYSGETPLSLAIKEKKCDVLSLFKQANLFFVPFSTCNIINLLHNGAQKLKTLCKTGTIAQKRTIKNIVTELFTVIDQHCASRATPMDGIMMLRDGWCFCNATFDDLQTLVGNESVMYLKNFLRRACNEARFIFWRDREKFKKIAQIYPFIFEYDEQLVFDTYLYLIEHDQQDYMWALGDQAYGQEHREFTPNLTFVDEDGNTLLHHAVILNKPWAVKIFASKSGFLLKRNNCEQTALDIALASDDKKCLRVMLDCIFFNCESSSCFDAFLYRKEIKKLFKGITNVAQFTIDDIPLLHRVVKTSWHRLCEIVVKNGANVHVRDACGKTALWYASSKNMFIPLLAHGALLMQKIVEQCNSQQLRVFLEKVYAEQEKNIKNQKA